MLHVATAHFRSPRWIAIQTRHLREHAEMPYRTWASLEQIDPAEGAAFDHVVEQYGSHAGKLNHLAGEISRVADDDDLIMFLDGDAFPIAPLAPFLAGALARAPLVAVRRAENVDSPQPHPCFCVTSVSTWRLLAGDWSGGPVWPGGQGWDVTDVGSLLMRKLELAGLEWVQVLRSNKHNLDPVYYAVYGDIVYHHGAGFRAESLTATHRSMAPDRPEASHFRAAQRERGPLGRRRQAAWERDTRRRLEEQSERFYRRIEDGGDWLAELI